MSDLTIFGQTFTDVKGIKATDTDGNEVVYGGGYSIADVLYGNLGKNVDLTGVTSFTRQQIFSGSDVETIDAPDLETTGNYSFYYARNLKEINAPLLSSGREYAFSGCTKLTTLIHPYIFGLAQRTFENCSSLRYFVGNPSGVYTYTFAGCTSLEALDFGDRFHETRSNAFRNCAKLETLIIRATTLPDLQNRDMFGGTPFASAGTGGTLYVPQALISSYQSANNWSTILGYPNNQILPIEGSIYETQYADGTPIE